MVAPEALLVGAVIAVGILHTIVPDHWVPIALIARQEGWSRGEIAQAALKAGTGHVVSTLLIGLIVWIAGAAFATKFGNAVSTISSIALIAFGGWIAVASLRELRTNDGHAHSHGHPHSHGILAVESHPHGTHAEGHDREDHDREGHDHAGRDREGHDREGQDRGGDDHAGRDRIVVHDPGSLSDVQIDGGAGVLTRHVHAHRHGLGGPHVHTHEHGPDTWHVVATGLEADPPLHEHAHTRSTRTALLLILGSSPMVEGIPAFFAAGKFGPGLIAVMSLAFALSTILTYVTLCVYSTAGLQRIKLGSFEKYGEAISGGFIVAVGVVFLIFPIL